MNEDTSIKDKLESEMTRLKTAIDYIEQAEQSVREIQEVNLEYKSRHDELLKLNGESYDNIKSLIDGLEKKLEKKLKKNTDNYNSTAKTVDLLNDSLIKYDTSVRELHIALEKIDERVSALEGEIENNKKLKWYKRVFG